MQSSLGVRQNIEDFLWQGVELDRYGYIVCIRDIAEWDSMECARQLRMEG